MLTPAKQFLKRITSIKFVQDVGVLTAANILIAVLSFIQGVLAARWLGPLDYGIAALVMSYPAIVYGFFDARSSAATVKFIHEFSEEKNYSGVLAVCKLGYAVDIGIAFFTFLLVLLTASWAETNIVHAENAKELMLIYSAAFFPKALFGTSRSVLSVLGRFRLIACIEGIVTVVQVSLILGLILAGEAVRGLIVGYAIGMALSGVVFAVFAYSAIIAEWGESWLQGKWSLLAAKKKAILHFLVYCEMTELVSLLGKQMDIVIIGFFLGPREAGFYRLAKRFAGVVGMLVQPLQSVVYPKFTKLWGAGQYLELGRSARRNALYVGLPLMLVSLSSVLVVPLIIELTVGEAYAPVSPVAQLLFVGASLWLGSYWVRPALHSIGAVKFVMWNAIFTNITIFIGYVYITPLWGIVGMATLRLIVTAVGGHAVSIGYLLYNFKQKKQ